MIDFMHEQKALSSLRQTEIVYRWPDGHEEVRYRRPFGSIAAKVFEEEVRQMQERLGDECPYFVRHQ